MEQIKKSAVGPRNSHIFDNNNRAHAEPSGKKVARHFPVKSKALDYIGWNLLYWCNTQAVILEQEYKFSQDRAFRFDWAIPSMKLAVEFEGGIFQANSGHKTAKHYTKDTDKYNLAAGLGWRVLRFTALNYTNLVTELNKCL